MPRVGMIMAWKLKDNVPPEPASVTDLIDGDLDEVTELYTVKSSPPLCATPLDEFPLLAQKLGTASPKHQAYSPPVPTE